MPPSLVTCPTSRTGRLRSFATRINDAATARTCATPPAPPSTWELETVWIESTTSRAGSTASMCPSRAPRSDSSAMSRRRSIAPILSARPFTCEADSSPVA